MFSTVIIILFFLLNKKINLPIIILYLYHLSFLFISEFYVFRYGGDAIFYENYLNNDEELIFLLGRNSLLFFLEYISDYLSLFDINLLFNFIGFLGIYFLYQICLTLGLSNSVIILICLIPSLNFFTSYIGKDSLIFTSIMIIIHKTYCFYSSKNFFLLILAFSCLLFIRPYIFIIILPIYIFSYFFVFTKNKLILIFVFLSLITLYFTFLNLNDFFCILMTQFCEGSGLDNIDGMFEKVKSFGDISNINKTASNYEPKNIFYNIFSYLFFPLQFFELQNTGNSFSVWYGILESLYLLWIFYLVYLFKIKFFQKNKLKNILFLLIFLFIYIFIYLLIFPNIFFNFGLNIRQKIMVIYPILIFCLFLKNYFLIKKLK